MKPKKAVRKRAKKPLEEKYILRLYVTGATPRSTAAITNLRKLCDQYLPKKYELNIIDVYQQPKLAKDVQIIAAPTLIKSFPLPLQRLIGDMSNLKSLLTALKIHTVVEKPDKE